MSDSSYFLDTNIFLRAIVKDEKRQANECLRLLEKISRNELVVYTSNIILAELNWTLLGFYHYSKLDVVEILEGLTTAKSIKIRDFYIASKAVELYQNHNIKFIDCLIASHPKIASGKVAVVSYDKDFDKLGLRRLEPSSLV